MKATNRIPVCRKAFLSLYGVTNKEIFRPSTLVTKSQSPNDIRGKREICGNLLPPDAAVKVYKHFREFPKKVLITHQDKLRISIAH